MSFGPSDDTSIQPVKLDTNVRFSSIGGLKEHIKCLREMIIFPLMYPELFKRFKTRPAKGILFHGPPGTGKTLLARALANECSLVGGRRVSFFMRKGADVMNKYYGESERNLRMVFQTARKMKPSIIFFDEIDALAPSRKPANDHYASVVATLLAEMDGVCDRGDVVVIGATNRPDAMDPAIRRAGRFDRELYFPPPEVEDRRDILQIYTRNWDSGLSDEDLDHIAKITVGYLGSDIKALCSEAVLKAVRRVYPQIYESDCKLLINAQNVEVTPDDMLEAIEEMLPTGARYAPIAAQPLPPHTIPLLGDQLKEAAEVMRRAFPARSNKRKKSKNELGAAPSVFLITGECAESHLAPALLAQLEHCLIKELSVSTLHAAHVFSPKQAVTALFAECRRSGRYCVVFIRDLQAVWNVLASKNGAEVLLQLWRVGSVGEHTLLLAATNSRYQQLPKELQEVFPVYKDCIYRVRKPTETEVSTFLQPVITELPLVPPIMYQYVPPPPLPRAPTGPLENEQDVIRRLFREYDNLRELRCSLKKILRNLSADKRFQQFSSPVDMDVLPDYFNIVKIPMDLATIICKIDNKQYYCAKEFLEDIDLICGNALLYDKAKPDKTDKKFRQEACSLHSCAYTMVADEIPAALELECQLVARRRRESGDDSEEPENGWSDDFYLSKLANLGKDDVIFKRSKSFTKQNRRKRPSPGIGELDDVKRARMAPNFLKDIYGVVIKDDDQVLNDKIEDVIMAANNEKNNPLENMNIMTCNDKRAEPNNTPSNGDPKATEPNNSGKLPNVSPLIINAAELGKIMKNNVRFLCQIGLEALIDLHAQLRTTVYEYSQVSDRRNLPQELNVIVTRYVRLAKNDMKRP